MKIYKTLFHYQHNKIACRPFLFYLFLLFVPHSWVSELTQQAIAQLIGDPKYIWFNALIRQDAKDSPFTDVNAKAALSLQLIILRP